MCVFYSSNQTRDKQSSAPSKAARRSPRKESGTIWPRNTIQLTKVKINALSRSEHSFIITVQTVYHPKLSAMERKQLIKQGKVVCTPDVPQFVCRKLQEQQIITQAFACHSQPTSGQRTITQQAFAGHSQPTLGQSQGPGGTDVLVMLVREHKTGVKGAARLMLNSDDFLKLSAYVITVRPLFTSLGNFPQLLLSSSGPLKTSRSESMAWASATTSACQRQPRCKRSAPPQWHLQVCRDEITRQLLHTGHTQARHYEGIVGPVHAARTFKTMEGLRCSMDDGKEQKQEKKANKREKFSDEQTEQIKEYCLAEASAGETPPLSACEEFIRDHPWGKSAKRIQDKVKTSISIRLTLTINGGWKQLHPFVNCNQTPVIPTTFLVTNPFITYL